MSIYYHFLKKFTCLFLLFLLTNTPFFYQLSERFDHNTVYSNRDFNIEYELPFDETTPSNPVKTVDVSTDGWKFNLVNYTNVAVEQPYKITIASIKSSKSNHFHLRI